MAETVVCLLIKGLLPLLIEEAKLLLDIHKDILDIIKELEYIQAFLKDADARAEKGDLNDVAGTWVKQVREEAYHIEDVIDEYMIHVARRKQRSGLANFICKASLKGKKLKTRYDIVSEIRDIKESIQKTYTRGVRYGFKSSSSVADHRNLTWQDQRLVSSFTEESELVGIEAPRDELISWFDERATQRAVISVVGMGGIGKTTLAKKVYDNRSFNTQFDCHAWVTVSPIYNKEELLRSMINQFYQSRNDQAPNSVLTMDLPSLIYTMTTYLKGSRYVVLLDDIWQRDFWSFIRNVLPNNKGSKIIITTQSHNVASSCKESPFDHIHQLQPLRKEKAWELFCNKAFQTGFGGHCPPELTQCSRAIVERCGGLPLAIVTVGRLLSAKEKKISVWKNFHDNLGTELGSNPDLTTVTKILSLGYSDLPDHLKPCFLYLGMFPEDYSINCYRLIKLWIAEGFIEKKGAKTLEVVGEEYLAELVQRNLVQVSMMNFLGKAKRCRVHHLIREIILLKSHDLNFCQFLAKEDSSIEGSTRRLSTMHPAIENISKSLIRSILIFKASSNLPHTFLTTFCSNFKLLKVFDFQYAPLNDLPKEVGDLLNLRYLSVRGTKIKTLPKSIGNLYNLQILDLKFTAVKELPVEINMLHKLLYLLSHYSDEKTIASSFDTTRGVKIQKGVGCLMALQKLYTVEANHGELTSELGNLRQLRKLGVTKLVASNCQALCYSIMNMNHLQSLDMRAIDEFEPIDLSSISTPPLSVQHINLCGRIAKLPNWIPQLKELVILSICWSGLTHDPLGILQPLENLQRLWLRQAYEGEKLHFKEGWFLNLKVLGLTHLARLNMIHIDIGALPFLKELTIGPCQQLKEVPSGIEDLRNLTALRFFDMPKKFVMRTLPKGGPDFWKVRHISAVVFNRNEGENHRVYTLSDSNVLRDSYE